MPAPRMSRRKIKNVLRLKLEAQLSHKRIAAALHISKGIVAKSAVQVVERWILARLRHQSFASVAEVDLALRPLLDQLNQRPLQKLPGNRAYGFTALDAPALLPLPAQLYELARFKAISRQAGQPVRRAQDGAKAPPPGGPAPAPS